MKPKFPTNQGQDIDSSNTDQEMLDEKVIDDKVIAALREKLVMDATAPYAQLENMDFEALKGLTLNQALVRYPKLLRIMDDVMTKVVSTVSSLHKEANEVGAQKDDLEEEAWGSVMRMKKLGKWFYSNGYADRALRIFQDALRFFPEDGEICLYLADIHLFSGKFAEAASYYQNAKDLLPGDERIDRMLARVHIEMAHDFLDKDLDTAYAFYMGALDYIPNYLPALCGLGGVELIRDNKKKAREHFEAALKIDPSCEQALASIGDLYMSEHKDEKAEIFYQEALLKNQMFIPALTSMAKLYYHYRGNYGVAMGYIDRIIGLEPRNLEALIMKSEVALLMQNYDEAEEAAEKVLKLDFTNKQAFDQYCRLKNGDCYFPPKYGSRSQLRAVRPERQEMSRDHYFSLLTFAEPNNLRFLDGYSAEVKRDQEEKFGSPGSPRNNKLN